jgi:Tfp pilus assembly protein PilF
MRKLWVVLILLVGTLVSQLGLAQDTKEHAKGAVELGWRYLKKGDTDTALKRFNQALILDPDFAPAYFGIAYVYSVQNKLDLAIENYRKSIEKDATHSDSYSNLGLALLYSGRPEEAFPVLKKALELNPSNGDAHVNMALYHFRMKDYESAWRHIHLAQDSNAVVRQEFLRDLRRMMPEPKCSVA